MTEGLEKQKRPTTRRRQRTGDAAYSSHFNNNIRSRKIMTKPLHLACVALGLLSHKQVQSTTSDCADVLKSADVDQDGRLNRSEYATAVAQISPKKLLIGSNFDDLPARFQATFDMLVAQNRSFKGSFSSSEVVYLENDEFFDAICDGINGAIFREIDALNLKHTEAGQQQVKMPRPTPSMLYESDTSLEASPVLLDEHPVEIHSQRKLQTTQQCFIAMAIGDSNRDDFLSKDPEYVRFINQLSGNRYAGSSYGDLPGAIQSNFDSFAGGNGQIAVAGSKPGSNPTAEQQTFLQSICDATIGLLTNPLPPPAPTSPPGPAPTPAPAPTPPGGGGGAANCDGTVARNTCNTALAIADLSRDNLLSEAEYVRFVNRLSSNAYDGVSFGALPAAISAVYNKYATTNGQINVQGSKPGQTPDAAQDALIAGLCCETDLAIQNPNTPTAGPPPTNPPAPTPDQPTGSLPPTFPVILCRSALASSDFNRDDLMNQAEYVRFLNRLTTNQFGSAGFADLDQPLQDNFSALALVNSQIDIFGTKPGQTPNDAQEDFIEKICLDTAIALSGGGGSPPTPPGPTSPPSTPAPTPVQATLPPTFPAPLCRTGMAVSDFNRDDNLDEAEFVRFLNRLTLNEFQDLSFADLESPLPETFRNLAGDDGLINILGSKPGQAVSDEQNAFLEKICLDIAVALSRVGQTPAPTPPPSGGNARPTPQPGIAEGFNAFVISNTQRQNAARLQTGSNRAGLNSAYELFVQETVAELDSPVEGGQRRNLRQWSGSSGPSRRLEVKYIEKSAEIYQIVDQDCPDGLEATAFCQTVYGRFQVDLDDEDPTEISQRLISRSQARIRQGDLQETLLEIDPRTILTVQGVSDGPISVTLAPTPSPVDPSGEPDSGDTIGGDGGGGGSAGVIAGAAVGAVVLIGLAGYAYKKELIPKPSFGGGGKRMKKAKDDDDEDDFDGDLGGKDDDDDASDDEDKPSPTNAFGLGLGAFGSGDDNLFGKKEEEDDNDDDDDEEEDTGKKKKKKKKKDKESKKKNTFGAGLDSFGNESDNNNFGDYAFEDPSVTRQRQEEEEDGSVGGDDDNIFGQAGGLEAEAANAFGGDFFGTSGPGWGAAGGGEDDAAASNFFANSAFGDDDEASGSGSGSGSRSGSYSSSGGSSYHSGDEEGSGSFSGSGSRSRSGSEGSGSGSRSRSGSEYSDDRSRSSGSMSEGLQRQNDEMDAMIAEGNWDAIANAANSFSPEEEQSPAEEEDASESSGSGSEGSGSEGEETDETSMRTEDREKRAEYRAQVEALVQLVVPDEINKVDAMMEQFAGREAELVSTLQGMQERSANQRARAAVHKSATKPTRADGPFRVDGAFGMQGGATEGSAAGTAAIAAASLPIPADGMYDDDLPPESEGGFDNAFGQEQYDDEGSYRSGESGSYDSRSQSNGSYDSRSQGSRSYRSGEEGSYYSGEGSYRSGEGSYRSGEGSYRSGEDSYRSGEGSYRSGEGSYRSGEGSYRSGEGSYRSGEGSYRSGEDSYRSGDSRSYRSGEEGSYDSRSQGSRSYDSRSYSGSGSQGSRSYDSRSYSDGSRSRSQGSQSYYSDENSQEGEEGWQ